MDLGSLGLGWDCRRRGGVKFSALLTLRIKMAQKPHRVWSSGPKTSKYESLEP